MPWPLDVTIARPDGSATLPRPPRHRRPRRVRRVVPPGRQRADGERTRSGSPAPSPVSGHPRVFQVSRGPDEPAARTLAGPVRIFDADAIRSFLAGKPELVIAVSGDRYRQQADEPGQLRLRARGLAVEVADERSLFRRHPYPRVFDPYLKVYRPTGPERPPAGMKVDQSVKLQIEDDGRIRAIAADGSDLGESWRDRPRVLATVAGKGFIDYSAADAEEMYEPGCKIYIDADKKWTVVLGEKTEVKATPEARARWSRPWTRLGSFVGRLQPQPAATRGLRLRPPPHPPGRQHRRRRAGRRAPGQRAAPPGRRCPVPRARQGAAQLRLEPVRPREGRHPDRRARRRGRPGRRRSLAGLDPSRSGRLVKAGSSLPEIPPMRGPARRSRLENRGPLRARSHRFGQHFPGHCHGDRAGRRPGKDEHTGR